jgi:cell division protease FtsH
MFAGLGASRIRKLFAEARKHAPSIVFIDELDAVGAARTGHGFNREQDQTLNQLLVELDGFAPTDQVVVMGASNRLQDLDPALLRPGRFDRQMLVAPPDLAGREQILRVHTRSKPLAPDVDLPQIARQTAGLTGADLANIANEAAIFAGRRKAESITGRDFDNAIDRVVGGLQQRRVLTEKERRILAYHEAGHALMSYLMAAAPVQKVTIVSRGNALGYTLHLSEEDRYMETKEELVDLMKIALAGRAAEQVVFGRVTNGAASDLEKATEIARSMVFEWGMSEIVTSRTLRADNYGLSEETKRLRDHEQARLTDEAYAEALRLIAKHRVSLDRMARALLERETLVRDEVLRLLRDVEPESHASETVGMPVVVAVPADCDRGAASIAPWTLGGSTTSVSRSTTSTRRSRRTRASSARSSSIARPCRHRAFTRPWCASAKVASSCSSPSGKTRRSAGFSPSGARGCTTSRTRSTTSRRRWRDSATPASS